MSKIKWQILNNMDRNFIIAGGIIKWYLIFNYFGELFWSST